MLDSFFVIFVLVLYILEIVFSHKIVGVAALLFRFAAIYHFATRMSICRLPADFSIPYWRGKRAGCHLQAGVEVRGLEPLTSSLQSWRSTN